MSLRKKLSMEQKLKCQKYIDAISNIIDIDIGFLEKYGVNIFTDHLRIDGHELNKRLEYYIASYFETDRLKLVWYMSENEKYLDLVFNYTDIFIPNKEPY